MIGYRQAAPGGRRRKRPQEGLPGSAEAGLPTIRLAIFACLSTGRMVLVPSFGPLVPRSGVAATPAPAGRRSRKAGAQRHET